MNHHLRQHKTARDPDHLNKQPNLCASDSADAVCIKRHGSVDQAELEASSDSIVSSNLSFVHSMELCAALDPPVCITLPGWFTF